MEGVKAEQQNGAAAAAAAAGGEGRVLPLSTALLRIKFLSHPLFQPILSRLSLAESLLPTHPLASPVVLLALVGAIYKGKHYWRLMLAIAGCAEPIMRSFFLLDAIDHVKSTTQRDKRRDEELRIRQETKHLLSFWVFYAVVQLGSLSSFLRLRFNSSLLPSRISPSISTSAITPVLSRISAFTTSILASPTFSSSIRPKRRAPFPQPSPFIPSPPPLLKQRHRPTSFLHEIIKLLLLWQALRRDSLGIKTLWEFWVGPMLVVWRNRTGHGAAIKKVVVLGGETSDDEDGFAGSASDDDDDDDMTNTGGIDSHLHSPSPSPGMASQQSHSQPPTPQNIPYRLTSTVHPIHARSVVTSMSDSDSGASLRNSSVAVLTSSGSTTTVSRSSNGPSNNTGGYDLDLDLEESEDEKTARRSRAEWDENWRTSQGV